MELRPARRDDLPDVVAVMNAVDEATLGEPDSTEADVGAGWDESGFDVERDAVVAVDEDRVVGYAEVFDRGDDRAELEIDVFVEPGREQLAAPLLERTLARASELAAPGARMSTWLPVGDDRAGAFEAAGFTVRRRFVRMRIDPLAAAPAPPPDGIRISAPRPGIDERTVHGILVQSFARHARPISPAYERYEEQNVHHPDYDPELWALAWHDDEPVGAITVFDHGDLAFIRHLGVLDAWRGRGIASALLAHGLGLVAQRGQRRADLGVDVDDVVGALRLYEQVGFRTIQQLQLYERSAS